MQPCPITPYGVDKLASECMGHVYARNFDVEFVSLRYLNVFGSPQDPSSPYSGLISIFCNQMLQGVAPTIYGDAFQSRNFVHVTDVVRAKLMVMKHPKASASSFNVRRGVATNLLEIIKKSTISQVKTCYPSTKMFVQGIFVIVLLIILH